MSECNDSDIGPILGRISSGVFILTVKNGEQETGMLASWVMQAGFEPPMISVSVKKGRYIAGWLDQGLPFVLNVVAEGQVNLLKHFSRGFEPQEPAFEGVDVARTPDGIPVLSEALGHLECKPSGSIESGDHHVFLAEVTGGCLSREAKPMIHVRKNGMQY